jgi:hypothetical protein
MFNSSTYPSSCIFNSIILWEAMWARLIWLTWLIRKALSVFLHTESFYTIMEYFNHISFLIRNIIVIYNFIVFIIILFYILKFSFNFNSLHSPCAWANIIYTWIDPSLHTVFLMVYISWVSIHYMFRLYHISAIIRCYNNKETRYTELKVFSKYIE